MQIEGIWPPRVPAPRAGARNASKKKPVPRTRCWAHAARLRRLASSPFRRRHRSVPVVSLGTSGKLTRATVWNPRRPPPQMTTPGPRPESAHNLKRERERRPPPRPRRPRDHARPDGKTTALLNCTPKYVSQIAGNPKPRARMNRCAAKTATPRPAYHVHKNRKSRVAAAPPSDVTAVAWKQKFSTVSGRHLAMAPLHGPVRREERTTQHHERRS